MHSGEMIETSNRIAILNVQTFPNQNSPIIHFEYSSDGGLTWNPMWVRPIYGGIPQEYIIIPGIFFADIQHATHIRFVKDFYKKQDLTVKLKFTANIHLQYEGRRSTKRYAPMPARLNPIIRSTAGKEIAHVTPDSIVYAYGGRNLYKSQDLGVTWDLIQTPFTDGNVTRIKKLSMGELLVIGNNLDGKKGLQVWKSGKDERNLRKVTTLDTFSDANSFWGLEIYDDIILFAPYIIQPRKASQTLNVYLSRDGGEKWEAIFKAPTIDSWHFHGIKLDPFESRIWVLCGDGPEKQNVWFTDNWGADWESLWSIGESPVQFTDLAVLPNCLIFGIDDPKGLGYMRLDKPTPRLSAGALKFHIHEAYFLDKIGVKVDATGRFITKDNVAYLPSESPRGLLTATKDGFDYYVLWDYTKEPGGAVAGITYIEATNTGKLIGYFKDKERDGETFIWIADLPKWIEI